MPGGTPALNGPRLARLLEADGWAYQRECPHGWAYAKTVRGEVRVTTIPKKKRSIPPRTLAAILGPKQTQLGKRGLRRLLEKYG